MKRTGKMESITIITGRLSNAYDHFNHINTEEDLRKENITISDYYDIRTALVRLNGTNCEVAALHSEKAAAWCKRHGLIIEHLYGNFYDVSTSKTY